MILKYPGSKRSIARWIINHFPLNYQNMTYLEPFFGSGSVFFIKERSSVETINDIDSEVFNLFNQIRDNPQKLIFLLQYTPWSREDYILAFEYSDDPLERARRFIVRSNFSRGSAFRGINGSGMRFSINEYFGFNYFYDKLPDYIKNTALRLKHCSGHTVQIENNDALKLISKYNRDNVCMYLDPPYVFETRLKKKLYPHEMDDKSHVALLELITASKAKILISGYNNILYQKYLNGWHVDAVSAHDESGNSRAEFLWSNFKSLQPDLFEEEETA